MYIFVCIVLTWSNSGMTFKKPKPKIKIMDIYQKEKEGVKRSWFGWLVGFFV